MEFIWFLLIGLVAGWLAGRLVKGGGFGLVGDIVVGVLGALLGGVLFRSLGVSLGGGLLGAIIVATIGAIVLIFILRLIKRAQGSNPSLNPHYARTTCCDRGYRRPFGRPRVSNLATY